MFEQLRCAVDGLRCLVGELEPDRFDGTAARTLVELFDEVERLGAAGKALATRQVVATGAWKHDGTHRDAASWLAGTTGATVGAARATVHTAAARCGPARHRGRAARRIALPHPDRRHRRRRHRRSHGGGRAPRARRARRCAWSPHCVCPGEGRRLHRRICAVRAHLCRASLRGWTDPDGAGRIDIRGPVDATAKIMAALEPYERELFERARHDQRRECSDALAFDALVALAGAAGSTTETSRAVTTVVRVDYAALGTTDATEPGEVCEIVGGGPVPVSVASGCSTTAS